ncbi:single-stranded DNA-binding protein [Clostridioides difficile]|uniref:single-stranded DNA-binding protein n=1 Tax=Clostridioides difficile TaxID=1496 RepID=UPI0021C6AF27|nr:single-stranded DNA-binding protein [Clostridioides difficile]UUV16653.1 single-stranded DNA-binding protein [Clostridioides difficile]
MINNVNIQGNLVSDGTFRNSEFGSKSYFNTIAVNSINYKGERERYFFPIRAHGKIAVYMADTTHKGNEITILGTLTQNPLNKEINILVSKYSNHDLNRVKISKYNQNNNSSYNQGDGYSQNNNNPAYNQGNGYNQNNNSSYDQSNSYNQNNNSSYNQGDGYSQNNNNPAYNQSNDYNPNNNSYNWENYDESKNNQNSTDIDKNDFSGLYV